MQRTMLPETKRYIKAIIGWCALYLALVMLPLVVVMIDPPQERRSFWVEFGVGLGIIGFALLVLQFALTARFRGIGKPFGIDAMLQFHRQGGLVAFGFIFAHVVVLLIAHPPYVEFFDPRVNFGRSIALVAVLILLIFVIATTLWRTTFGLPYEWWRLMHGIASVLIVFIGLAHALRVGHYFEPLWKQAFWVLLPGAAILLLGYSRLVKPLGMKRKPWRVTEVRPERDSSWTLGVEPVGHSGFRFLPGQYAWLTIHDSPFTLQQHPFSFACSAESGRFEFTIKAFGDFTETIKDMKPGTRAYLEGPYGAFSLEDSAPGAVFIAGGIGITPIMSMLRTARDRNDTRPFVLFYGNPSWEDVTFREEFDELATRMNLRVIHVIEEPPENWTGERGFITKEVLANHLDERMIEDGPFFVCGPPKMMDVMEPTLRELGVPVSHIRSERFDIV